MNIRKHLPDIDSILSEINERAKTDPKAKKHSQQLEDTHRQIENSERARWYNRLLNTPISDKKLPVGVKILGLLFILGSIYGLVGTVLSLIDAIHEFQAGGMNLLGLSTIVVTFLHLGILLLLAIAFCVFGIRLFTNKRVYAAIILYAIYVFLLFGGICSLMLYGVSLRLLIYGAMFATLVAFQVYLDPYLREERQLQRMLRDNELKHQQEEGILGRDETGKGYIKLDFFNMFWIFVIASIIGDVMETFYHVLVVDPGHWQDRAGLLFGPFSPIYGCGALLMTIFLNRFYKKNLILIFLASAVIGGLFEAFVSVFMQYTFGAIAWSYNDTWMVPLLGGRTCGFMMVMWGLLGCFWIKLLLPLILKIISLIPWNWRYTVITIAAVLMAADCVMSLQALDCWYDRLSNAPIETPIQHFYAKYFDNSFMENRFQSMTINPDAAVRSGHS